MLMLFRRHCPESLCDWTGTAWTRRGAHLLLDEHLAVCPKRRPMPTSLDGPAPLDLSNSQIFRCRYVPAGCDWFRQFQPRDEEQADLARLVHEDRCEYRHRMK